VEEEEKKMARREPRPKASRELRIDTQRRRCLSCGGPLWVAYHSRRTVQTLNGLILLIVVVRSCRSESCERYREPTHPEEEGCWVLPQGEIGLDVIALVGWLRYGEHRSITEIHRHLQTRGVHICESTVLHLMHRYEELVSLHVNDPRRLRERLCQQGSIILALDGLQPDVGHEVLWLIRDVISGEILLARALLSSAHGDVAMLLEEVKQRLPVPVRGIISDGQHSIRQAVAQVFPAVPHQLCHFHYLREAAKPIFEADRHAKKELKKQVRGVRPIERSLEGGKDDEAQAARDYCLAVRAAVTDDGRAPLDASGLLLHDRLTFISDSLNRVEQKRGSLSLSNACNDS